MSVTFLHITKTAGTAIKNSLKDCPRANVSIARRHDKTLENSKNVGIIIRDPWQRFCSGFWERKTLKELRAVRKNDDLLPKRYRTGGMGVNYTPFELDLFDNAKTPDELISYFRVKNALPRKFNEFEMDTHNNNFGQLCASYTYWLGNLNEYKELEDKVEIAVDINFLTEIMQQEFGLTMNQNPYVARKRSQFNLPQSYDISYDNLVWFQNWRAEDYKLVEYIKTRPYYRSMQ